MSEPLIGVTCDNDTPYGPCERDTGHAGECDAFGSAASERPPVDPLREPTIEELRHALQMALPGYLWSDFHLARVAADLRRANRAALASPAVPEECSDPITCEHIHGSPAAPRLEGPYTVRKIEDTADDWWDVLDASGEKIALCGEEDARRIAAALNAAPRPEGLDEETTNEVARAHAKFGAQSDFTDGDWLAVLTEEVGEAATECLRAKFFDPDGLLRRSNETGIPLEETDYPVTRLRRELVQVAAVSWRWIAAIDARLSGTGDTP